MITQEVMKLPSHKLYIILKLRKFETLLLYLKKVYHKGYESFAFVGSIYLWANQCFLPGARGIVLLSESNNVFMFNNNLSGSKTFQMELKYSYPSPRYYIFCTCGTKLFRGQKNVLKLVFQKNFAVLHSFFENVTTSTEFTYATFPSSFCLCSDISSCYRRFCKQWQT